MIIKQQENKFQVIWNYSIKNNKTIKNGKEYYFYNTVFPAELAEYFHQPTYIWIYNHKGHSYITKEEPAYPNCKRFKLFSKGNPQRAKDFTLSKKFFKELNGYCKGNVEYTLHLDEFDNLSNERGLLEIRIITD